MREAQEWLPLKTAFSKSLRRANVEDANTGETEGLGGRSREGDKSQTCSLCSNQGVLGRPNNSGPFSG